MLVWQLATRCLKRLIFAWLAWSWPGLLGCCSFRPILAYRLDRNIFSSDALCQLSSLKSIQRLSANTTYLIIEHNAISANSLLVGLLLLLPPMTDYLLSNPLSLSLLSFLAGLVIKLTNIELIPTSARYYIKYNSNVAPSIMDYLVGPGLKKLRYWYSPKRYFRSEYRIKHFTQVF